MRVPTEVVKQRMQTGMHNSISATAQDILKSEGPIGLYRGYGATLIREIPFSLLQFPLYESLKTAIKEYTGREAKSYEAAVCKYRYDSYHYIVGITRNIPFITHYHLSFL